ncbi:MAG: hypothetical protein ACRDT2_17630, partial [Natronosporangium sp.]
MVDLVLDLVVPLIAMAFAVTLVTLAYHLIRQLGRRSRLARDLVTRAYRPSQLVVALVALWVGLRLTADGDWLDATLHVVLLAIIGAVGWLVAALVNVGTDLVLRRLRLDQRDPLAARRIRTRLKVSHRVT